MRYTLGFCSLLLLSSIACDSTSHADLVLRGGKIVAVHGDFSIQEAVAF
jgi:hypothetical protein